MSEFYSSDSAKESEFFVLVMSLWICRVEKHTKKEANVDQIEGKMCEDVSRTNNNELLKKSLCLDYS